MATPASEIRAAASVILLREHQGELQLYLLRRQRKASFMASSYVFPGGIAEDEDHDSRVTAVRELFEESGVLLSDTGEDQETRNRWRDELNNNHANFSQLVGDIRTQAKEMQYFAHWITPSVEKRRYSAEFFLARMPEGQLASPDNRETVDEIWISPRQAIESNQELHLPPPQLRTMYELREIAPQGIDAVFDWAQKREDARHPLLPRAHTQTADITLMLPWDADYEKHGSGDSKPMEADHPLAFGHSRFVLKQGRWSHLSRDAQ